MRTAITTTLLGMALMAGAASAQIHGAGTPHGSGSVPHRQGHQEAERCEARFAEVVGQGLGFGMAFAADRNGYPGPTHVVELAERLGLMPAQRARVEALREAMLAESRLASAALLAAEARLGALFESKEAGEEAIGARVAEVERLRARARLIHLRYHLKTRDLLTEPQRALYHAARWSAAR